jgi:hypothetical protein
LTCLNTLVGISCDCRDVMGEQYTSLLLCPFKHRRVVCSRKTNVLNADNVQSWLPTQ